MSGFTIVTIKSLNFYFFLTVKDEVFLVIMCYKKCYNMMKLFVRFRNSYKDNTFSFSIFEEKRIFYKIYRVMSQMFLDLKVILQLVVKDIKMVLIFSNGKVFYSVSYDYKENLKNRYETLNLLKNFAE